MHFNQADIVVPESQGVQAFDRYAYVNNSPINYTDPSGHEICWEDGFCNSKGYNIDDHLSYYGVSLSGILSEWTESRKLAVLLGVHAVGSKLSELAGMGIQGAANVFQSVFGKMNIGWCDNCVEGAFGRADSDHTILFDGMYKNPTSAMRLVVHELGHIFDRAVCAANDSSGSCSYIFRSGTARDGLKGRLLLCADSQYCLGRNGHNGPGEGEHWGFAGGWATWQFGDGDGAGELWADMFLGWVFDKWEASSRGTNRQIYMNGTVSAYVNLIRKP